MTQVFVPIRIRFLKVPTHWDVRLIKGNARHEGGKYLFPKLITDSTLDAFKVEELDAWSCREEFFSIPTGDEKKLIRFMDKVGQWTEGRKLISHWSRDVIEHVKTGNPSPLTLYWLWRVQDFLKRSLTDTQAFKAMFARPIGRPKTGYELLLDDRGGVDFPLRFELSNVASGVVTVTTAYEAILASIFFDIVRGTRFKCCARADCGTPFALESKHAKIFCSWYCGHLANVRKHRREKRDSVERGGAKQKTPRATSGAKAIAGSKKLQKAKPVAGSQRVNNA